MYYPANATLNYIVLEKDRSKNLEEISHWQKVAAFNTIMDSLYLSSKALDQGYITQTIQILKTNLPKLEKEFPDFFNYLSSIYWMWDDTVGIMEAQNILKLQEALYPNRVELLAEKANLLDKQQLKKEAIEVYKDYCSKMPEDREIAEKLFNLQKSTQRSTIALPK